MGLVIRDWMKMLLAILAGNLIYILVSPYLPAYLRHTLFAFDPGVVFDLMICIAVYLAIRLI